MKQISAYCPTCNRQSMFQKQKINHILHLILTVLTFGVWGVVWICLAISNSSKPVRCVQCGLPKGVKGQTQGLPIVPR